MGGKIIPIRQMRRLSVTLLKEQVSDHAAIEVALEVEFRNCGVQARAGAGQRSILVCCP